MFLELLSRFNTEVLPLVYKIIFIMSPVLVPAILIYITGHLWVRYVQYKYILKQKPFLIEIKIPKDIQKSPMAMEIILAIMQQSGASNYSDAFLDGKVAPWFSLELASFGGEVHFYIWGSENKFKKLIEAQIYAQYPTVEVHDVPLEKDYVRNFYYNPDKISLWGVQFGFTNKDVYPIKTYVDYALDKDQKDEYRIDPMTAMIEFFGSAEKGNQLWMQILIRKHDKRDILSFQWGKTPDWKAEAQKEIDAIREQATPEQTGDFPGFPNPTKGQVEKIAAIERSISKLAFDTCIRGMYIADKDSFNSMYISGLIGSTRQYNSVHLNGFKPKGKTDVSDEYKDLCAFFPFMNKRKDYLVAKYKKSMLNAYRLRSFFYPPYQFFKQGPLVMNTEELATIYHFPGNVSSTPTLAKIPSKKSEAPANLPIKK